MCEFIWVEVTLDEGSARIYELACLSFLDGLSFFLGLLFYSLFDEVVGKRPFLLIGQVHRIIQVGGDLYSNRLLK